MRTPSLRRVLVGIGLCLSVSAALAGEASQRGSPISRRVPPRTEPEPDVAFLAREPVIDGRLDPALKSLPRRAFAFVLKGNPADPDVTADYRLAYGTEFLYIYIEYNARELICRDRGYQNGDGFLLVLNRVGPDGGILESYTVAYHPELGTREPYRQMLWQHDDAWPFARLGPRSRFVALAESGHVGFEALLRWEEVPPFHPWLGGELAYNLVLSKAVGATDIDALATVLDDTRPDDPFGPDVHLRFGPPSLGEGAQSYALLERNHVPAGTPLRARIASIAAAPSRERMAFRFFSGEGTAIWRQVRSLDLPAGLSVHEQALEAGDLVSGGYEMRWEALENAGQGRAGLTVLPPFELETLAERLAAARRRIADGTYQTLRFLLADIGHSHSALKPTETCAPLRADIERFLERLSTAEGGRDPIAGQTGLVRRAFLSEVDHTLQPYTVLVPPEIDARKKYPAIVFLHGSDSDDRSVQAAVSAAPSYFPAGFFVVAPNGRGPRTDFGVDFAQEDIREAVADAVRNYPIDPARLVLAGFSMGGYGVYRTLWERPGTYAGAAVFSGSPDARSAGPRAGQPDFRDPEPRQRLRRENIVVVHGGRDRNCPVEATVDLVAKLKQTGVSVRLLLDEQAGHEMSRAPEVVSAYLDWLSAAVAAK